MHNCIGFRDCRIIIKLLPALDNGESPLHCAVLNGKGSCANCLLQHNADVNAEDNNGRSVIQSARNSGHPKLMEGVEM